MSRFRQKATTVGGRQLLGQGVEAGDTRRAGRRPESASSCRSPSTLAGLEAGERLFMYIRRRSGPASAVELALALRRLRVEALRPSSQAESGALAQEGRRSLGASGSCGGV